MAGLAARLEAEALALPGLGLGNALAGAERAAALRRVLRAGGVESEELDRMLLVAAAGLRAALPIDIERAYGARVAALDRWLAEPPPP
jgi:hypothetical protein